MTTFYVYTPDTCQLLGQLQAIDADAAQLLANHLWSGPIKVLNFRLQLNSKIAA